MLNDDQHYHRQRSISIRQSWIAGEPDSDGTDRDRATARKRAIRDAAVNYLRMVGGEAPSSDLLAYLREQGHTSQACVLALEECKAYVTKTNGRWISVAQRRANKNLENAPVYRLHRHLLCTMEI